MGSKKNMKKATGNYHLIAGCISVCAGPIWTTKQSFDLDRDLISVWISIKSVVSYSLNQDLSIHVICCVIFFHHVSGLGELADPV
jgi:hypothetical protein